MLTRVALRLLILRRRCAGGNPLAQHGDLLGLERFALGRHPLVEAVRGNFLDEEAGVGFAGDNGGPVLAALAKEFRCVESEPAVLLERAVTGIAARGEDRLHRLEVIHALGGLCDEDRTEQ